MATILTGLISYHNSAHQGAHTKSLLPQLLLGMAMSMQEFFYGQSEPAYFAHYGRQEASNIPYSHAPRQIPLPEPRIRRMELITFDLMVPMCCARCEDQVRDALFALGSVQDVLCDPRNQRVTVTGCVNPAQALKQVRRVKNGAAFWSDVASTYSAQRYEVSSHQKPHRVAYQDNNVRNHSSFTQSDAKEQRSCHSQYNNHSGASDRYTRSFCPAYRDTAQTYYISLNPTIATVEESQF